MFTIVSKRVGDAQTMLDLTKHMSRIQANPMMRAHLSAFILDSEGEQEAEAHALPPADPEAQAEALAAPRRGPPRRAHSPKEQQQQLPAPPDNPK